MYTCFVFFLIITVNSFHIVYNILLIFSIICFGFFLYLVNVCVMYALLILEKIKNIYHYILVKFEL